MSKPKFNNRLSLFDNKLNFKYKIKFRCKCGQVAECLSSFKTSSESFRKFLFKNENQCIRKGFKKSKYIKHKFIKTIEPIKKHTSLKYK